MEYNFIKPNWQRGDSNLRRRYQSTALLSTTPSTSPKMDGVVYYSLIIGNIIIINNIISQLIIWKKLAKVRK